MPKGLDLHAAAGGTAAWAKLATAFYSRVDRDPLLRPLFPGKSLRCAIEEFTAFLVQFSGGPSSDSQFRWWVSLRESHLRFAIGEAERAAWMANMHAALDEADLEEPLRAAMRQFFEQSSAYLVNRGAVKVAPASTGTCPFRQEVARRWEAQRALDEAVLAVRNGDAERAIAVAESDPYGLVGLLSVMLGRVMMGSESEALEAYVQKKLADDPALIGERYAGRTLLHDAAAKGKLAIVHSILRLGGDPNVQDGGGHAPLYSVANEYGGPGGGAVVRALVAAGADVNANDGAKQCTALHMAARRGHTEIAQALLDRGAQVDARDSLGDTPLRRAVNCGKVDVARLLLDRGADARSQGSKKLTPMEAARTSAMKELFSRRP